MYVFYKLIFVSLVHCHAARRARERASFQKPLAVEDPASQADSLTIQELLPEVAGRPDKNENSWLFQKIMEAKDLPFHHFLGLGGSNVPKFDPSKDGDGPVHPVVLVGGLFSSLLEANLSKKTSKHSYCAKDKQNVPVWLSVKNLLPFEVNCWMENMAMSWNVETNTYDDNGVHVETSEWGEVAGFAFDMWDIVYAALQPMGYGKKSIRGVQYDWRYSSAEWKSTGHYDKTKKLIEQTYEENNQRKVVPISISQGSQYMRNFFVSGVVDAPWKDKYIQSWVSLSGIFDGTPDALPSILFPGHGEAENVTALPWVKSRAFRDMAATWAGGYALLPTLSKPLSTKYVVYSPTRNYTLLEMREALSDAGLGPTALSLYDHAGPEVFADAQLPPPGVDVHCWYGRGSKTVEAVHYDNGLSAPPTGFDYTDGDGSVHEAGLQSCREWPSRDPTHHVDVVVYPGLQHKDLVMHQSPVSTLVELLQTKNKLLKPITPDVPEQPKETDKCINLGAFMCKITSGCRCDGAWDTIWEFLGCGSEGCQQS